MAGKNDALITLKKQIKENSLIRLYLLFGEEQTMRENYVQRIADAVPDGGFPDFNRLVLKESFTLDELGDAIEGVPMMAEKKLVLVKDSGFFKTKQKPGELSTEDIRSFFDDVLPKLTDDTVLVFDEEEVDKRSFLYKAIAKRGLAVEFSYLKEYDMIDHIMRTVRKRKKRIDKTNAAYLANISAKGLDQINNELEKLCAYCGEEITKTDIDRLVSRSAELRIFDLTDAMTEKNVPKTLSILEDLRHESAFGLLYMVFSAFEKILHARLLLDSGAPYQQVLEEVAANKFTARKYTDSAKRFTLDFLLDTVAEIPLVDLSIKQGILGEWEALEQFVLKRLSQIN